MTDPTERKRLAALEALGILDTPPEERFDRLTRAAAARLNAPIAALSFLDTRRQVFKSRVGIDEPAAPRAGSICNLTIDLGELVLPDAQRDPRVGESARREGIGYYAGVAVEALGGERVGTLCVGDTEPRPRASRSADDDDLSTLFGLGKAVEAELLLGTQRASGHQSATADATASVWERADAHAAYARADWGPVEHEPQVDPANAFGAERLAGVSPARRHCAHDLRAGLSGVPLAGLVRRRRRGESGRGDRRPEA